MLRGRLYIIVYHAGSTINNRNKLTPEQLAAILNADELRSLSAGLMT